MAFGGKAEQPVPIFLSAQRLVERTDLGKDLAPAKQRRAGTAGAAEQNRARKRLVEPIRCDPPCRVPALDAVIGTDMSGDFRWLIAHRSNLKREFVAVPAVVGIEKSDEFTLGRRDPRV